MNAKTVGYGLIATLFFGRAYVSYLDGNAMGMMFGAFIGICWLLGAAMQAGGGTVKSKDEETPAAGIVLVLLLGVLPMCGFLWWQLAGPGSYGYVKPSERAAAAPAKVTTPVAAAVAEAPTGPSRDQIGREKHLASMAASTTLHRADFTVTKCPNLLTLREIGLQLFTMNGVAAVGTTEYRSGDSAHDRVALVFDSALTDMTKLGSPIEFAHKVKLEDVTDATISGAELKSLVTVDRSGFARVEPTLGAAPTDVAEAKTTESAPTQAPSTEPKATNGAPNEGKSSEGKSAQAHSGEENSTEGKSSVESRE